MTKSPTSGGRGRWRVRWVELVSSGKEKAEAGQVKGKEDSGHLKVKKELGHLNLLYYSSEKKRKNPIGE